jgi:hypothetical protein
VMLSRRNHPGTHVLGEPRGRTAATAHAQAVLSPSHRSRACRSRRPSPMNQLPASGLTTETT